MTSGVYQRISFSLTKLEINVLYRKYIQNGLNRSQASDRIDLIKNKLKDLVRRLKEKQKSPEYIKDRFNREFENICRRAEVGM